MIQVTSRHQKWEEHDWYVMRRFDDGPYILYAPTLKLALHLSDECGRAVSTGASLPESIYGRFSRQRADAVSPSVARPQAFHLAIALTNNCTLACDYCHAEADRDVRADHRILSRSIEYAFERGGRTPGKRISISFAVGGEPTMDWTAFVAVVDQIRRMEREKYQGVEKIYLSMTTNCFYGRVKRDYVAANFDKLTLSIDGDKEVHDLHRPTRAGRGSYDLVSETVAYYLKQPSVDVGLRATVSAASVGRMAMIVDHFHSSFGGGYAVAFEPLIQTGRACRGKVQPPDNAEFAVNFWHARQLGEQRNIRVISSGANISRLVGRYCGAMAIPSFTVCTNGAVTACHRDQDGVDYRYGVVDADTGNVQLDGEKIDSNVRQTETPEECLECFARWHCAGDCPDIRRLGYSRCDINRFIVYQQLKSVLEKRREAANGSDVAAICDPDA